VNLIAGTFTAVVSGATGSYLLQSGLAVSTVGLFVGPNVPQKATDVPGGTPWTNPNGILGDISYASTTAGQDDETVVAGSAINLNAGSSSVPIWTNPNYIFGSIGPAAVTLNQSASQMQSVPLLAVPSGFAIPSGATVVGVEVSMNASAIYSASSPLSQGPKNCASGTGATWGTPTAVEGTSGYATFSNNNTTTTVESGNLVASIYTFALPSNVTVTGITVSFNKYATTTNPSNFVKDFAVNLTVGGVTVGSNLANPNNWSSTSTSFTYGGSTNLWGTSWTPAQVNASTFGVVIQSQNSNVVLGGSTANVQDVRVTVNYTTPGGVSGNASATVQLALNGSAVGLPSTELLTGSVVGYTTGGPAYLWGTTFAPSDINNSLGVLITANAGSTYAAGSNYNINANTLALTVYYTTDTSDALQSTLYSFTMPATSGITGLSTSFQAYSSANTSITAQLLKNGIPVGTPKTQVLTSTPMIYTLGAGNDVWGATWLYSDVNNTEFGVQFTAVGEGATYLNDVDMLVFITPGLSNFNYIKSYIQNNNQIYTLALDSSGIMWEENVTSNPGILYPVLTGILPGSFAQSSTMNNREHIMFSDLSIGTDRPRVYNGIDFDALSQVGPGAPPTFTSSTGSSTAPLVVTAYSIAADVVTFTFTAVGAFVPAVNTLYKIAGTGNVNLDGSTFAVLGTPAPSTTGFSAATLTATGSATGLTASATLINNYGIVSITQDSTIPNSTPSGSAQKFNGQVLLWSAGPGSVSPGFTVTCYYAQAGAAENAGLLNSFAKGYPVYVYIAGVPSGAPGDGTQLVTGHGTGIEPEESGVVPYFTFTTTTSAFQLYSNRGGNTGPGNNGTFQLTLATLTTATPIPNLTAGAQVQIAGATPAAWNNTWTIEDALLSGSYDINSSQMLANGTAQFQYSNASATGQATVTNGQVIELSGLTNNLLFNTTGVVSAATGSSFQIKGFPGNIPAQANPTPETGQAVTFGTEFVFDPGINYVGEATPSSIFGDDTGTGTVSVIGGSAIPIGAGVRQGVCYFITENEYETTPSAPFEFTTSSGTNQIVVSQIPIGPPNVIARGLAFTEAGQNGVAGANFYVIEVPVTTTVNDVVTTVPSTIINDNITTQIALSFTDAVLLNSREIDVQGDDLFNLIELGSSAWCVPYASRMFYGLQLNKLDNFTNLTFDGGYNPNPTGNIQPLGWSIVNPADQTLITSAVTGQALYIKSAYGVTTAQVGLIYQPAFQDAYLVPIIKPNTLYSVRVTAAIPSGNTTGTLVIDLTDYSSIGFGNTYGSFSVPFSSMSTVMQVFTGTLLTTEFTNSVSTLLQLREYVQNMGAGADIEIDRIEVFPTVTPYLAAQVFGSYANQTEAIDASGTGGIIDTTTENAQPCFGGFVNRGVLYLLKQNSMYSTQEDPNSEPGGWGIKEVSPKVGSCGIHAYDSGEGWAMMACRAGIFGFEGSQPARMCGEIIELWNLINWYASPTIVLRNDVYNHRFYCLIPLPTGINPATGLPVNALSYQVLPDAPYNPTPTTPNVMLMCNYLGLETAAELFNSPGVHSTMFGTLADVDLRRKWSIWQIPSPYADFIVQQSKSDALLYICNGIASSKVYELNPEQLSDDGQAIHDRYCCYGFVNAAKAVTEPIFGKHAKRYNWMQWAAEGAGQQGVTVYPNTLLAKYPYTVPGRITLYEPTLSDFGRPLNIGPAQRVFVEFSTNAIGAWMDVSKLIMTGFADPHSPISGVGGGNLGITTSQQ